MSKQISVKTLHTSPSIKLMLEETHSYLDAIGFVKEHVLSISDQESDLNTYIFKYEKEVIIMEYRKTKFEESLKLKFNPLSIHIVYDILLMRFNQIKEEHVLIFNE